MVQTKPTIIELDMGKLEDALRRAEPVFEELTRQAAQGEVVHNDDTTVKILAARGERARQATLAENGDDSAKKSLRERTGTFTSGIVSTREGR